MFTPSVVLACVAVAVTAAPFAAATVVGLGGTASRAVAGLTEPGALLVWGTLLAALAHVFSRRPQKG
jgi:hypothetical protein